MCTHHLRLWATATIASFALVANVACAQSSLTFYLADGNDSCFPHEHVKNQEVCNLAAAQMQLNNMGRNGISSFNAIDHEYVIHKTGCYAHVIRDWKNGNGDSSEYYDIDFFSRGEDLGGKLKGFAVCKISEEKRFLRYNQTVGNTTNIQDTTMARSFNTTRSKRSKSKNAEAFLTSKEGYNDTDALERGTKFDGRKKSKAGSSQSKTPKILGRYKRAKSNVGGKGSKGNVSSCKSASEKSTKSGRRPKAFYKGKKGQKVKGTKAPSQDTKAPNVSSSKDTKAPKAKDSPAKGKGNLLKTKSTGIGGYKGRKSAKSSTPTKGKGHQCSTEAPSPEPSAFPVVDPSSIPSEFPSTAPTPTPPIMITLDTCIPGCQNETLNTTIVEQFEKTILAYAFGTSLESGDVLLTFRASQDECTPCNNGSRRSLQNLLLLQNEISVEMEVSEEVQNSLGTKVDSSIVVTNMEENKDNINSDLQEVGVVVNTIEVQTSAPTAAPIPISTDPPSPPPVELSRAVLARKMSLERRRLSTALEEENEEREEETSPAELHDIFISENYYADLPEFVAVDVNDPYHCKCVDCDDDEVCGGLWAAKKYDNSDSRDNLQKKQLHMIISHCKNPLDWVESFTEGYEVASIHVVTKCGEDIEKIKAPSKATIEILENIGRCDHTYAYYITNILPQKVDREDDSIVVFLKDDISEKNFHQAGRWNTFEGLLSLASSENGFACGVISDGHVDFGPHRFLLSAYHEVKSLFEFAMENYSRNIKGYVTDESEFLSQFSTFGQWWDHLNVEEDLPELIQVCYGGVFAASTNNIYRRDISVWKTIETSLSRGNNIQEGHYAERSWAALMSTPLQPFQIEALKEKADGVYMNKSSMHGALLTRPQLYLHIGTFGTTSTEYLADALIDYKTELKTGGYNIAVHGKFDNGVHGFPNVDRLGSCMWSDMNKSLFPEYMKEAAVCESNVLQDLSEFMDNTLKEQKDLIISNPWLVRPGTAESLAIFLDPVWNVKTVVYYRRYFEWITLLYNQWRQDLLLHLSPEAIPSSSFRYIDFLREYNKRLFYGKDVNEDGYPVRDLGSDSNHRSTIGKSRMVYLDRFDIISDSDIEELPDLQESPYYAAKQFFSVPRFRDVVVVNFHDIRGVEVNFFCNVLDDADEACKAAVDTEELLGDVGHGDEEFFVQNGSGSPFLLETAVGDIVIAAIDKKILTFEKTKRKGKFNLQLNLWNDMIKLSLHQRNMTVEDLPSECLYSFESEKLLEVSLAYEKKMLPAFYSTRKGAKHLKKSFRRWRFCSVDTKEILESSEWDFIFENVHDFTLHNQNTKAYVHIGAPKTGSTSIQDTMAADRLHLKEDKFFVAVHGQLRPPGTEDYIVDNMLVKCDQLGACLWSEEERQIVIQGSGDGDAGKCPDYLLHEFDRFASMAKEQKSNIVISNEWLNRQTSEIGLSKLLEDFDTTIVIYYRRFYDWMISAHYQWHFDLGMSSFEALQGKIRLVDFIRMFCQRLFASSISNLHADTALADLTDINEYTYHAYKRYGRISEFDENIQIVNFHGGNIIKSFYCDVLKAPKACELEKKRIEEKQFTKTRSKSSTMLFDLAVGLQWSKYKETDEKRSVEDFHKTAEKLKERLLARGLNEDDLPRECLSTSEQDLLLRVSLEYENILLPSGSFIDKGKNAMRQDFAKYSNNNRFCSVDLDIVNDPNWRFLLEQI